MTRHRFTLASSLALGTMLASSAFAQAPMNQTMASPRWSQPEIDPAAQRARYVVAPAPTQLVDDTTTPESHSFLPNWFGWKNGNSSSPTSSNQTPNNSNRSNSAYQSSNQFRPKTGNTASTPHVASRPSSSMPPDPATMQDDSLPGLDGSPMPRTDGEQPATNNTTSKAGNSQQSGMQSRSLKAKAQTANGSNEGAAQSESRPLLAPSAGASSTSSTTSATRNSPGRRPTPHINPDELRRELSGTFPAPATASETTPHAAPAAAPADAHGKAISEENDAVVSDSPAVLPTTKSAKDFGAALSTKSKPAAHPEAATPAAEPIGHNAPEAFGASQHTRSAYGSSGSVRMPFSSPIPPAPQTARGKEAFGDALQVAGGGDPNVLASNQTPVLNADIRGPKQIQVGREAVYRVRLQNQSDVPAEGIVASVRIPSGTELTNTTATQGAVQPSQDAQQAGQLQWRLARLEGQSAETLEIHLIPRESRPLELGVSWTLAPVGSRAVVEVQEAKLQLEIAGPNEVLFDKPQVFKMTLTNPGTGPAENVKIELMPPGGGKEAVSSHPLGDLAPGASQTVEVELTPREAGKMFVKAVATAEGGLTSDASKEIFCRKPELEVDWRGPATKYAGTMATYYIRVRNPGTAPADDITVHASLPDGAEFTSASEGQSYDAQSRQVAWRVGTLGPGDDNYMELKCVLKTAGANQVKMAAATGSGTLSDNKVAETNVIAIADLKLDVSDPNGPVAVGAQAVYEIHIQNRGANSAKDVNVIAMFSDGLEPEQAEGAIYTVADGRVSFRTIEDLPAGRDVVLRVRAHAVQPGTHVFRAEVLCRDLEIKLAAEGTTRFYADEVPPSNDKTQKQSANRSQAFQSTVK